MIKRTLLSLVIVAIFFSANLFAKDLPGDIAGARADYLNKKLSLTAEQYSKVYTIFLNAATKMDAMGSDKKNKDMDQTMKKMHDETMSSIEKILTKDQIAKWGDAKEKVCKVKVKKHVKKIKTENKDEVKKDEKTSDKKDMKKDEKKDVKKEEKKDEKKK